MLQQKKLNFKFTPFLSFLVGGILAFIVFFAFFDNDKSYYLDTESKAQKANISFFNNHYESAKVCSEKYKIPIDLVLSLALIESQKGVKIESVFFDGLQSKFPASVLLYLNDCLTAKCLVFELNEMQYFSDIQESENLSKALQDYESYKKALQDVM